MTGAAVLDDCYLEVMSVGDWNEDEFAVPDDVRRAMLAWYGAADGVRAQPKPRSSAAEPQVYPVQQLSGVLEHARSDPEAVTAARAFIDGNLDVDGTGVVLNLLLENYRDDGAQHLLEHLQVVHGLRFTVDALLHSTTVRVDSSSRGTDTRGALLREPQRLAPYRVFDSLLRLRDAIARVERDEYDAIVELCRAWSRTDLGTVYAAFLCSSEPELAARASNLACEPDLIPAYGHTAEQLTRAAVSFSQYSRGNPLAALRTAFVRVGSDVLPYFVEVAEHTAHKPVRSLVIDLAAFIPTDAAAEFVLDQHAHGSDALRTVIDRFPRRVLRLLVEGRRDAQLREIVIRNADTVRGVVDDLDPPTAAAVRVVLDGIRVVPDADPGDVPDLLRDPPWAHERPRPTVIEGVHVEDRPSFDGAPPRLPESEMAWVRYSARHTSEAMFESFETDRSTGSQYLAAVILAMPARRLRGFVRSLGVVDGAPSYYLEPATAIAANRVGLDAYPFVVSATQAVRDGVSASLAYVGAELAPTMAANAQGKGKRRERGRQWLQRHGSAAVRYLVPAAVGKPAKPRAEAQAALRIIAAAHGYDAVRAGAAEFDALVREAVDALLAADPATELPARIPVLPAWLTVQSLPQLILRDSERAVPRENAANLVTMLQLSDEDVAYVGVKRVLAELTPQSAAAFGWNVFEQWLAAGAPSKETWVLSGLGWVGDDDTARRLAPMIARWPGESQHKRAVVGLGVLAAIGTDVALMQLHRISMRVKFKALKERAQERIAEIAESLNLSTDELADRLVPDFGLTADGGLVLDFGPRSFTVGFDEQLKPTITDDAGKPRKALPKPAASDDAESANAAVKAFAALKKDVRTVAADQVARLEGALRTQRRWSADDFRTHLVEHPLVIHLVRRLVWATYPDLDARTAPSATFRVAEDRTFADLQDDTYLLPDGAVVGLAHPLHLGAADLAAWSEVFADYELLQPFPQLGRPVVTLSEGQASASDLVGDFGVTAPTRAFLGLTKSGWNRGTPMDAGVEEDMWIAVGDRRVTLGMDQGIVVGDPDALGAEQTLTSIAVDQGTFGDLPPIPVSELLAGLQRLGPR